MRGLKPKIIDYLSRISIRIHHGCVDWNIVRMAVADHCHSHPSRMRGLKPGWWLTEICRHIRIHHGCVDWNLHAVSKIACRYFASITDAWIETFEQERRFQWVVRIHHGCVDWNFAIWLGIAIPASHPSRMRGLKLIPSSNCCCVFFASITDAWIETRQCQRWLGLWFRIHHGCVDWNITITKAYSFSIFASITDAWIETVVIAVLFLPTSSHPSRMRGLKHLVRDVGLNVVIRIHHGCVDWNSWCWYCLYWWWFASITDAWIETTPLCIMQISFIFASITDAWIETYCVNALAHKVIRIHHGCVDWNTPHAVTFIFNASHPSRMRGLKPTLLHNG